MSTPIRQEEPEQLVVLDLANIKEADEHASIPELSHSSTASASEFSQDRNSALLSVATLRSEKLSLLARLGELEDEVDGLKAEKDASQQRWVEENAARREAEETVGLLRTRLEDAKRRIWTLQSQQPEPRKVGLGVEMPDGTPESVSASTTTTSRRDKRATVGYGMVPTLSSTGSTASSSFMHRRQSSISDSALTSPTIPDFLAPPMAPSQSGGLRQLRLAQSPPQTNNQFSNPDNRRASMMSWRSQEPSEVDDGDNVQATLRRLEGHTGAPGPGSSSPTPVELQLKSELEMLKRELELSKEARESSESALTVLRQFIAEGNGSGGNVVENISLPPLPTDSDPERPILQKQASPVKGSWSLFGRKQSQTSILTPIPSAEENQSVGTSCITSWSQDVAQRGDDDISPLQTPTSIVDSNPSPGLPSSSKSSSRFSFFGTKPAAKGLSPSPATSPSPAPIATDQLIAITATPPTPNNTTFLDPESVPKPVLQSRVSQDSTSRASTGLEEVAEEAEVKEEEEK